MTDPNPRQQMVARIRRALGRRGPVGERPVPPTVDDAIARLDPPDDGDRVDEFVRRAEAVGAHVERVASSGLVRALIARMRELEATSAVTACGRIAQTAEINEALRRRGVEVLAWRGDREMAACYQADVGITDVHGAIAESGSIVVQSDAGHGRGLSLAPPAHVAIVRASDVAADLLDYMRRTGGGAARPADLPAGQTIITGPSKTADIEGVLVTGVHGPGKLFILLVQDA